MNEKKISVFTPAFNRMGTLPQLYESLVEQTYKNFEWIIIDDGSTDGTEELVNSWIIERRIDIVYKKQSNNGKHIAMNNAVSLATGYFITVVDSDDFLKKEALKILIDAWNEIPREEWKSFISVKSNCFDIYTGESLGPSFKNGFLVCNYLDARYKFKVNAEMQSLIRIEALREYPNPNILGGYQNGGLRYYPETIWQDLAARKYLTKFISESTCGYRMDSSESLLGRGKKYNRYRENFYLWKHIINDNSDYFWYSPKEFFKAYVGFSMDLFFNHYSIKNSLGEVDSICKQIICVLFIPLGYVAYLIKS